LDVQRCLAKVAPHGEARLARLPMSNHKGKAHSTNPHVRLLPSPARSILGDNNANLPKIVEVFVKVRGGRGGREASSLP